MLVFVLDALLCVPSRFAIILKRKRKLVACFFLLSFGCLVAVDVLWLFLYCLLFV